jgi:uncharacterized membrane protein
MDFLLWAVRSLHVFGMVLWFGGMLYQEVVVFASVRGDGGVVDNRTVRLLQGFVPFLWMGLWTIAITGVALMLFSPRFAFLHFDSNWSILLAAKQSVFLALAFFSFGQARMIARLAESADNAAPDTLYFRRAGQLCRLNIFLGIVALLLASAMQ